MALKDFFIDALLAAYPARIAEAGEFARRNRVLLLRTMDGVGIDVSFGALPFEERVVSRATLFAFGPGLDIRTCWAEDRIVLKLFASRPLDIRDAEGVAIRNKEWLGCISKNNCARSRRLRASLRYYPRLRAI